MTTQILPEWLMNIDIEDINFIKKFILASGSLKELASAYDVSYPTVRLRLDRLIQKININEDFENDSFMNLVKTLVINEEIKVDAARKLISEHKKSQQGG